MTKTAIFPIILLVTFVVSPALAHSPAVIITHVQGQELIAGEPLHLVVPTLPWTIPVEGTVTHTDPGALPPIFLFATDNEDIFYGPERPFSGAGNETLGYFNVPWTVYLPGVHEVVVTAQHGNKQGKDGVFGPPGQLEEGNGCKAAPAIATNYLNEIEASKRGIISELAKEAGKNGSLWAKESCRPEYESQTLELVVELQGE